MPRIAFVNKMDRVGADFASVVSQLRSRLLAPAVPVQLPIGLEDKFRGVVDLVRMKGVIWPEENFGMDIQEIEIPAELRDEAKAARERMSRPWPTSRLADGEVLEGKEFSARDQRGAAQGPDRAAHRPGAVRLGVPQQGRAVAVDAVVEYLHRRSTSRRWWA